GLLVSIELPVRHAYLLELVGNKQELPNAIAITSLMANCGRLLGPALAGFVISAWSEAACFVINAITFVVVIVTFLMMRVTASVHRAAPAAMWQGMREGLAYAWQSVPIRLLLALLVIMGLLASPYMSLMPALVRSVFQGNAEQMGLFVGASGLGGVVGTLYLAARPSVRGLLGVLAAASFAAGTALALLAWSGTVWVALPLLTVIGFGMLVASVSVNMILQTIVDDDKRGRIMSLYTAAFLGMSPFGSLAAGTIADAVGIVATLTTCGMGCAAAALYIAYKRPQLREHVRPIYARVGV
ncbi:MAG TPA: MFS transporter, partial [Burkholderiales bacterium]|nr:MFS transporter [Burkholderiales bacterium]